MIVSLGSLPNTDGIGTDKGFAFDESGLGCPRAPELRTVGASNGERGLPPSEWTGSCDGREISLRSSGVGDTEGPGRLLDCVRGVVDVLPRISLRIHLDRRLHKDVLEPPGGVVDASLDSWTVWEAMMLVWAGA